MGSGIRVCGLASAMHACLMQCGLYLTRHWHQYQYCTVNHSALVLSQATSTVLEARFVCQLLWVQRVQGLACEMHAFLSQWGLDLNRNIGINVTLAPWFTLPWISHKQRRNFLKHAVCRMPLVYGLGLGFSAWIACFLMQCGLNLTRDWHQLRILHRYSLCRGSLKSNTDGSCSTLCLSDAMGIEGSGFSAWNACFSYATWFNSDSQYWHRCRHCTVIHSALVFSQATSTVLEPLCVCRMLLVYGFRV